MRKYFLVFLLAFKSNFIYKANVFFKLFQSIIGLVVAVAIWTALYANREVVGTVAGEISLADMITYSIMAAFLSRIVYFGTIYFVGSKIHDGSIATELMKPYNFGLSVFSNQMGENVFSVLFSVPPILIFGSLVYGINFPGGEHFVLFLLSTFFATVIGFLITYVISLFAFWYTISWHLAALFFITSHLFSGLHVPLWFFPDYLYKVADVLPFKLMFYVPASIFLEKFSYIESLGVLKEQLVWIVVLLIMAKVMNHVSFKKLVIQGG